MGHSSSADLSRPFVNSTNSFPAATHSLHLRRLFLRLHCLPLKDALGSSRRHAPQIFITSWHLPAYYDGLQCPGGLGKQFFDVARRDRPTQRHKNDFRGDTGDTLDSRSPRPRPPPCPARSPPGRPRQPLPFPSAFLLSAWALSHCPVFFCVPLQ